MLAPLTKKQSVVQISQGFLLNIPIVTEDSCHFMSMLGNYLPIIFGEYPHSHLYFLLFPVSPSFHDIPWQEICERMFFSMINEGFKILEVPLFEVQRRIWTLLHLASKIQQLPYPSAENHFPEPHEFLEERLDLY